MTWKFAFSFLLISSAFKSTSAKDVSVFAHMVNTPGAVRWALTQGVNSVEMDIQFDVNNNPTNFQHSVAFPADIFCDCLCPSPIIYDLLLTSNSECKFLSAENSGQTCYASSTAEDMTVALGGADVSSKLALIYIDSKLSDSMTNLALAGANIVRLINKNVFGGAYQGQVIINGQYAKYVDYLKGALAEARNSPYADRYFYTLDFEGTDFQKPYTALSTLGTNNIVYWTGTTGCADTGTFLTLTYKNAISSSAAKNVYAQVGIWTIDQKYTMTQYLNAGANAIMANLPREAVDLVLSRGDTIRGPGNVLVPITATG